MDIEEVFQKVGAPEKLREKVRRYIGKLKDHKVAIYAAVLPMVGGGAIVIAVVHNLTCRYKLFAYSNGRIITCTHGIVCDTLVDFLKSRPYGIKVEVYHAVFPPLD